ncbi:MAG: Imm7 family immunity protein [Pyrinomonadaceae bacterium]
MFEYHGWAVVRSDDGSAEADDELMHALQVRLAALPASTSASFQLGDPLNGLYTIMTAGLRNHYRAEIVNVFWWLAQQSRRSYGLLYVRDDDVEGDKDVFQVHRLLAGQLQALADPFLS